MILDLEAGVPIWMMLAVALVLDAVIGEAPFAPGRLTHPIIWIGRFIGGLEERWNNRTRTRGVVTVGVVCAVVLAATVPIALIPFGWPLEMLGAAILLAHRSLVQHVGAVADGLDIGLAQGRQSVAMIVGRDPEQLDEAGVARAAVESAAENFSDGVVAPAFWFAVAGLPGIALYKAVNTADSMIGHRTERYQAFGWAAARLDDVLNWVPARLTAMLFLTVGGGWRRFDRVGRDAPQHKSVNAGWPEAAMAVALDVALAGPRVYAGAAPVDDPYMNAEGRAQATAHDIRRANAVLWRAWWMVLGLTAAVAAFTIVRS